MGSRSRPTVCSRCRAKRHTAYVLVGNRWLCGDCLYELEWGGAELGFEGERPEPPKQTRQRPSQEERLFPLPPPEPKQQRGARQ